MASLRLLFKGGDTIDKLMATFMIIGLFVVIAIVGFVVPAIFWGIWYAVVGSIPKFMGFSRFWLDTISGVFYLQAVVVYLWYWAEAHEEISHENKYTVTFYDYWCEEMGLVVVGLLLAFDFGVSLVLSFAIGLAGIVAVAGIAGFVYGCWKLMQFLGLCIACGFCAMVVSPNWQKL